MNLSHTRWNILRQRPVVRTILRLAVFGVVVVGLGIMLYAGRSLANKQAALEKQYETALAVNSALTGQVASVSAQLSAVASEAAQLKAEDQYLKNQQLQAEIAQLKQSFKQSQTAYEQLLDLKGDGAKTQPAEERFAKILAALGRADYGAALTQLTELEKELQKLQTQLAAAASPLPSNVPVSNAAPSSGSSRQVVETDAGSFVVDLIAGDLNSTRVQVETAAEGNCADNCPVSSLADFVARSGGFAGINGPYFCPASYPSCAGKTNSFDTLLMNKHKVFFNSDNNVYSVVPALVFSGNQARIMKSAEVARDGGADAVIASQPALVWGGEVAFGGDGDPKKGSRGSRSFIAVKDSTVFIGVVRNATVAETALVMKRLGMQHALNLDSGGSTALMLNGKYLAGPGRQTPFGIVLVRK